MRSEDVHCTIDDAELSAWTDGELSPLRAESLREHVPSCAHCRDRMVAFERLGAQLASSPLPPVPSDLRARLQQKIDALPEAPRGIPGRAAPPVRRRWSSLPIASAALAAAAATVYVLFPRVPSPLDAGSPAPPSLARVEDELAVASEEEIAIALELDTIEDFDVISNLELLEALVAMDAETG